MYILGICKKCHKEARIIVQLLQLYCVTNKIYKNKMLFCLIVASILILT